MEYQVLLNVWQISQQQMQRTIQLHKLTSTDFFIDNSEGNKQSKMLYTPGVLQNLDSEDLMFDADHVGDTL